MVKKEQAEVTYVRLRCVATCYMPVGEGHVMRYEDEYGDERDDIQVPEDRVAEFLATGNFKAVTKS